jgi:hypothetical protein
MELSSDQVSILQKHRSHDSTITKNVAARQDSRCAIGQSPLIPETAWRTDEASTPVPAVLSKEADLNDARNSHAGGKG